MHICTECNSIMEDKQGSCIFCDGKVKSKGNRFKINNINCDVHARDLMMSEIYTTKIKVYRYTASHPVHPGIGKYCRRTDEYNRLEAELRTNIQRFRDANTANLARYSDTVLYDYTLNKENIPYVRLNENVLNFIEYCKELSDVEKELFISQNINLLSYKTLVKDDTGKLIPMRTKDAVAIFLFSNSNQVDCTMQFDHTAGWYGTTDIHLLLENSARLREGYNNRYDQD